jgi:hypothetical protein
MRRRQMAERAPRALLLSVALLASACGSAAPPTPAFQRAEVVRSVSGGSACAACAPRAGEQIEACHLGSLEPALLARREAQGDLGRGRDATVCLYRSRQ